MLLIPLGPVNREVRRWPWVTVGLVALNLLVFAAGGSADRATGGGPEAVRRWGFVPARPSLETAVGSAFVHGDGWHLAGNMVALLATGPFLEDVYGRTVYAAIYVGSAVVANHVDGELRGRREVPRIGASGAVFGVEGAFTIRLGGTLLRFFLAPVGFLPFAGFRVRLRAAVVLLFGFMEQTLLAGQDGGTVAFGAHVGGFAFGVAAAVLIRATGLERRVIHPGIEAEIGWRQDPLLVRASAARSAGNPLHARRTVEKLLGDDPGNADAWALAARLALERDDGAEAVRCAVRAVSLYLAATGGSDAAADVALEVLRKARPHMTSRFGYMTAALMERRGQTPDAVSIYEEVAARYPSDQAGRRAAGRLATLRPPLRAPGMASAD
jgi:membrane associated rhomboid family serine protease